MSSRRFGKWIRKLLCCVHHNGSDSSDLHIEWLKACPRKEWSGTSSFALELLDLEYTQLSSIEKVINWLIDNDEYFQSGEPLVEPGYVSNDFDATLATCVGSCVAVEEVANWDQSVYFDCISTRTDSSYNTCLDD